MHSILKQQLSKLALDENSPPETVEEWRLLLQSIEQAYQKNDEVSDAEAKNSGLYEERKLLEAQVVERTRNLQESEARNNAFLGLAPNAIIILDSNGFVVEFNAKAEKMFGYKREDVLSKLGSDLIIPEDFRARHVAALAHFDTGRMGVLTPKPLELPAMRADGSEFPTELSLSAFHVNDKLFFTSVIQDITNRKESEKKLAAQASFSEENDAPVLRVNRQGVVEYSNKPGEEILNAWGANVGSVVTGKAAKIVDTVFGEETRASYEWSIGEKAYILRFVPIIKSGYINIYGTDITKQKVYEKALVAAKEIAEKSSHSKSEFLAMMSHEIRTPMNGVMGLTELLLNTELNEKQNRYANNITKSANVLLRIIDDVLDISKIDAGKLELAAEYFKIENLLSDLVESFRERCDEKGVALKLVVSSDLPDRVQGDSERLQQILINLVSNAVKFTACGEVQIALSVLSNNGESVQLHFEVSDSGVGMDASTCERIFESFTQADQSTTRLFGGTGLGLAIVKRLVGMMGGEVGVESEKYKGSRFWFTLTMLSKYEVRAIGGEALVNEDVLVPNIESDNKKLNVLLAEDNLINQEVAVDMIESLGHKVDVVDNGKDALKAVKEHRYDLIFMDCRMPLMDGYEATRCIRQYENENNNSVYVPIIALTANAMTTDIDKCKEAGMDDFVSKPFSLEDIETIVERW